MKSLFSRKTRSVYGNDGAVVPPTVPPAVPPTVPPPPPAGKFYTQEELNTLMASNRKGMQDQLKTTLTQLEELKNVSGMTQKQRDELQAQIEVLSQTHMSEKEKLENNLTKTQKDAAKRQKELEEEATKYKSSFENLMITDAITKAAMTHKAANAGQLEAMLARQAKVVPEVDANGAATGKMVVKLPVRLVDPKTKEIKMVDFNVEDAVLKMREDESNSNLFLFDGKPGIGGSNAITKAGEVNWSNMTTEQHIAAKKALENK